MVANGHFSQHAQFPTARGPWRGGLWCNSSQHSSHWSHVSIDRDALCLNPVISSSPGMPNKEIVSDNPFVSIGKHQNKVVFLTETQLIVIHRSESWLIVRWLDFWHNLCLRWTSILWKWVWNVAFVEVWSKYKQGKMCFVFILITSCPTFVQLWFPDHRFMVLPASVWL